MPLVDRLRGVAGSDVSDRVMPRAPTCMGSSSAKLSGLKEMPLGESTVVLL